LILLKALLLYLLAFGQAVAGEAILTEITARWAKNPILWVCRAKKNQVYDLSS